MHGVNQLTRNFEKISGLESLKGYRLRKFGRIRNRDVEK